MCITKCFVAWPSSVISRRAIGTVLFAGIQCLSAGYLAVAQTLPSEGLQGSSHRSESSGFYIPSLQTLLMMPLSRVGDRMEASWSKPRDAGCSVGSAQCDNWVEPSYSVEAGITEARRTREVSKSHQNRLESIDEDEHLAVELNAPVKLDILRVRTVTMPVESIEAVPVRNRERDSDKKQTDSNVDSMVQFASGVSTANGVRVTGVSQSPSSASQSTGAVVPTKEGDLKDRYMQRKRLSRQVPSLSSAQ